MYSPPQSGKSSSAATHADLVKKIKQAQKVSKEWRQKWGDWCDANGRTKDPAKYQARMLMQAVAQCGEPPQGPPTRTNPNHNPAHSQVKNGQRDPSKNLHFSKGSCHKGEKTDRSEMFGGSLKRRQNNTESTPQAPAPAPAPAPEKVTSPPVIDLSENQEALIGEGLLKATFSDGLQLQSITRIQNEVRPCRVALLADFLPSTASHDTDTVRPYVEEHGGNIVKRTKKICIIDFPNEEQAAEARYKYKNAVRVTNHDFGVQITGAVSNCAVQGPVWVAPLSSDEVEELKSWGSLQRLYLNIKRMKGKSGHEVAIPFCNTRQVTLLSERLSQLPRPPVLEVGTPCLHVSVATMKAPTLDYTMKYQACTSEANLVDRNAAIKLFKDLTEEAKSFYDLTSFTFEKRNTALMDLDVKVVGRTLKDCTDAKMFVRSQFKASVINVNSRVQRALLNDLFQSGRIAKMAEKAGVATPDKVKDDKKKLIVKGAKSGFEKFRGLFAEEFDQFNNRCTILSVNPELYTYINENKLREELGIKDLYPDCVFISKDPRSLAALKELKEEFNVDTDDDFACHVCKAPTSLKLKRCKHAICDSCLVTVGSRCRCKEMISAADLYDGTLKMSGTKLMTTVVEQLVKKELAAGRTEYGLCPIEACGAILDRSAGYQICPACFNNVCPSCSAVDTDEHITRTCAEMNPCTEVSPTTEVNPAPPEEETPIGTLFPFVEGLMAKNLSEHEFYRNPCVAGGRRCGALTKFMNGLTMVKMRKSLRVMGQFAWHRVEDRDTAVEICHSGWAMASGPGEYFTREPHVALGYGEDTDTPYLILSFVLHGGHVSSFDTHIVVDNPTFSLPLGLVCSKEVKKPLFRCPGY